MKKYIFYLLLLVIIPLGIFVFPKISLASSLIINQTNYYGEAYNIQFNNFGLVSESWLRVYTNLIQFFTIDQSQEITKIILKIKNNSETTHQNFSICLTNNQCSQTINIPFSEVLLNYEFIFNPAVYLNSGANEFKIPFSNNLDIYRANSLLFFHSNLLMTNYQDSGNYTGRNYPLYFLMYGVAKSEINIISPIHNETYIGSINFKGTAKNFDNFNISYGNSTSTATNLIYNPLVSSLNHSYDFYFNFPSDGGYWIKHLVDNIVDYRYIYTYSQHLITFSKSDTDFFSTSTTAFFNEVIFQVDQCSYGESFWSAETINFILCHTFNKIKITGNWLLIPPVSIQNYVIETINKFGNVFPFNLVYGFYSTIKTEVEKTPENKSLMFPIFGKGNFGLDKSLQDVIGQQNKELVFKVIENVIWIGVASIIIGLILI